MSNVMIGFLLGLGFSGWVYAKISRKTGGNTQSALIVAACAGLGLMVIAIFALGFIS